MAQPSTTAQNLSPEIQISAAISPNPVIRQPAIAAAPEARTDARMLPLPVENLQLPVASPGNPVAEVQAKLRAALDATPKTSTLSEVVFRMMTTLICVLTATAGLALGIACVLLGAAIFLFPVTAGLSLAAVVVGSGYLGYRVYTGSLQNTGQSAGINSGKKRPLDESNDIFEALSAGRFSAAGVA